MSNQITHAELDHSLLPKDLLPWANSDEIGAERQEVFRPVHRRIAQLALDQIIQPADTILEIGSGTGELGRLLASSDSVSHIQLDKVAQYNQINRILNPSAKIIQADTLELPIRDEAQDIVTALNVLDILNNPKAALSEIQRVLKPEGSFVHLQDRHANLSFLIRHLEPGLIPFANVVRGSLTGFQLVSTEDYEAAQDNPQSSLLQRYVPAIARNPNFLQEARLAFPTAVEIQSEVVRDIFGDKIKSVKFNELFNNIFTKLAEDNGFQMEMTELPESEAVVSRRLVNDWQLRRSHGYVPIPRGVNVLYKGVNGEFNYSHDESVSLDDTDILLRSCMNVLISRKLSK